MKNTSAPRKPPKNPTSASLAASALFYLERFATTEEGLRRLLKKRIARAAFLDPAFAADLEGRNRLFAAIEEIIATHRRTGVLNDALYAEMKTESLRRGGRSRKAIRQKLAQKGLAPDLIEKSLATEEEAAETTELEAAKKLVRKRGLQRKAATPEGRRRALASLSRAGFAWDVAKQALEIEGVIEEEETLSFDKSFGDD